MGYYGSQWDLIKNTHKVTFKNFNSLKMSDDL